MLSAAVIVLTSLAAVTQAAYLIIPPVPVTAPEPGIRYNPAGHTGPGSIILETFLNPICPDIIAAWPVLKEVEAYYGGDVSLVVNVLSLSYHGWSHLVHQGFFCVRDLDSRNLWNYFEAVITNITDFYSHTTRDKTEFQMLDTLAAIAEASTDLTADTFRNNIYNYGSEAVNSGWKYGVRRGAAGQPWYVVNGVNLEISATVELTFDDWRMFLDPILAATRRR